MVEIVLPKVDQNAVNDLLYLAKRLGGIVSLIPVLESTFSLDQALNERSTQLSNLDQEVTKLAEQKTRLDDEIVSTDQRVAWMLAEAQTKYNTLIEQGKKDAKSLIDRTRSELDVQVSDLVVRVEELKTQAAEMKNIVLNLDREIQARQDKLNNINFQIEEFRRSI